jgi:hypothetical protein
MPGTPLSVKHAGKKDFQKAQQLPDTQFARQYMWQGAQKVPVGTVTGMSLDLANIIKSSIVSI